jgi:hypothetical protein
MRAARALAFPARNGLVPQLDFMLPSPTKMLDQVIAERFTRNAAGTHHALCRSLQALREHRDLIQRT